MLPVVLWVLLMLSVNTNLAALTTKLAQQTNTRSTATVMQQLSTGKRINSSADDAAGIAISSRLVSQIRGLNQAVRNTNDGISLLQTAESAFDSITNALQRMRELRVQSLNDTNNARDKAYIESEITSLQSEIARTVKDTEFNGMRLLDGTFGTASLKFALKTNSISGANDEININLKTSSNLPNLAPSITSPSTSQIPENTTLNSPAYVIEANAPNGAGQNFTYSITGGDDAQLFNVDSSTGVVTFKYSPNFESPYDKNGDNKYEINVGVSDGSATATKSVSISVTDVTDGTDTYLWGQGPNQVMMLDLNNDGKKDIITSNASLDTNLSIALANQDGTYQKATLYSNGLTNQYGIGGMGLAAADFNSDGVVDFAVPSINTDNISVFLGNVNGTLLPAINLSISMPQNLITGDFNGDGKPDLLAKTIYQSSSFLAGNGNATFRSPVSSTFGSLLADLNEDGKIDLVDGDVNRIQVRLGIGDGTFFTPTTYQSPMYFNSSGVIFDVNHDGHQDLVMAEGYTDSLTVFLGDGTGSLQSSYTTQTGIAPLRLSSGDLNADGNIDIVTIDSTTQQMQLAVLLGKNDGTFQPTQLVDARFQPWNVSITDINGDGHLDLAVPNHDADGVSLLFGRGDGTFGEAQFVPVGDTNPILTNYIGNIPQNQTPATPSIEIVPSTLDEIDQAIAQMNSARSDVGAAVSRLTFTAENLSNQSMKSQQSLSRIQDTDYSTATTDLAKRQIIQQAAMAMMAQANQQPQAVIQLVKSTTS